MKKIIVLAGLIMSLLAACSEMKVKETLSTVSDNIISPTKAIDAKGGVVFQEGDYVTIVLPLDQVFETGTANFLQSADALINESAKIIDRSPDSLVLVAAHSDDVGSGLSNAKLTRKQAMRMALALWESRQIDTQTFDRFQFVGMGDTKPIANSTTSKGQALNRRIQITIYPKAMTDQPMETVS